MKFARRRVLQLAATVAVAPRLPQSASALDDPTRPLRWIVGFPPGGGADTVTRIMAQWLSERLGQSIVVENKPGAASNISIQAAVSSPLTATRCCSSPHQRASTPPPEIIARLNKEINAGLADPATRARLATVATTPIFHTPESFGANVASEIEKWGKVIKASGARPE